MKSIETSLKIIKKAVIQHNVAFTDFFTLASDQGMDLATK
jgi:hypothetical protein